MRLLLIIAVFALACNSKKPANSEIIPKQQMTRILWDIIQVDEFAADFLRRDTLITDLEKERKKLYLQVFGLHKVSREQFSSSFKYYAARPDDMKLIFDSLGARGARERNNVYLPKVVTPK